MTRNDWKDYSLYLFVRLIVCLLQALPLENGVQLARGAGWLAGRLLRSRQKIVLDNLAHAYPKLSAKERKNLAQEMWSHLFLSILESALAPRKIHETNWRQYIDFTNDEGLMQFYLEGRAVLLTSAHFGNFELANYAIGIRGLTTHAVARPFDNPYLHRFVNQFRRGTGQVVISKYGSYREVPEILNNGGVMVFLADQSAGPKGCWVDFFGRPASTQPVVARLSKKHDAPIVVGYARRTRPMHFELCIHATADPRQPVVSDNRTEELTQWYTSRLEECIRLAPEQYWWLHRRWKDKRELHRDHLKRFLFFKEARGRFT